jgi:glycosyltransferase 2 family protein
MTDASPLQSNEPARPSRMRVMHNLALRRVVITLFVLLVLVFFGIALVNAWNSTGGELPSVPRLLLAGALWSIGLLAGAFAWATLLGGRRVDHGAALLVSQLGKYVPGGVWQVTGQVGLARSAGVRLSRGAAAFSVLALTQVIAGCTYALLLAVTWSSGSSVVRILIATGGAAGMLLLDRRWMVWLLGKIPRTRDASNDLVPNQRQILIAWCSCLVTLGSASAAYLVVLSSLKHVSHPFEVIAAYASAWTVGFIAVPIPSGVGVREAVLVGLLHDSFPSSVLVAASVYQRLVSVAAEGILAAIAAHRVRPRRLSRANAPASAEYSADSDDGTAEPSASP